MDEQEGVKAIIALQKLAGIDEPEEKARKGWQKMKQWEKESTMKYYTMWCKEQT